MALLENDLINQKNLLGKTLSRLEQDVTKRQQQQYVKDSLTPQTNPLRPQGGNITPSDDLGQYSSIIGSDNFFDSGFKDAMKSFVENYKKKQTGTEMSISETPKVNSAAVTNRLLFSPKGPDKMNIWNKKREFTKE